MPPEPTFSRSHLSAFRNSFMATTTAMTRKTKPLPQQVASPVPLSCCHKQRYATRSQSQSSPWTASSNDDEARPTRSPASESPSRSSSSAPSSSQPSSPPQSHLSPDLGAGAKKDPDGTISPATIYEHYVCVTRRLFRVLAAERQRRVASSHAIPPASARTRPSPQVPSLAPRALDWPPSCPHPTTPARDATMTTTTLDELPVSANCSLPEYQLTQEWFERVISDLREVKESSAAGAAVAGGVGTDGNVEAEAEAKVAIEAKDKDHRKQLDW